MSEVLGAAGQVASAYIQASAIKDAADAQIAALERQRDFVYNQLEPGRVNQQAIAADIDQARNRLAAQGLVDPALLQSRYNAEEAISRQAGALGAGSEAGKLGTLAAGEAATGVKGMGDLKTRLIDEALKELNAGATLPPDVQAELVKAGLEKSGSVTGKASAQGTGGTILRTLLGTAGLALKSQRQEKAAKLGEAAQGLEESRQRILGTLFPNLSNVQLNQLQGQQRVLQQSQDLMPEVGLGGNDIANIWLARVGATNQLSRAAADAAARSGTGVANAWASGLGGATRYASSLPTTAQTYTRLFGGGGGGSADADYTNAALNSFSF